MNEKTQIKLEKQKGMCLANKNHTFFYVKENKKGLITMKCSGCKKFSNIIILTIKQTKGR